MKKYITTITLAALAALPLAACNDSEVPEPPDIDDTWSDLEEGDGREPDLRDLEKDPMTPEEWGLPS